MIFLDDLELALGRRLADASEVEAFLANVTCRRRKEETEYPHTHRRSTNHGYARRLDE
jgi:hypothetical protein